MTGGLLFQPWRAKVRVSKLQGLDSTGGTVAQALPQMKGAVMPEIEHE